MRWLPRRKPRALALLVIAVVVGLLGTAGPPAGAGPPAALANTAEAGGPVASSGRLATAATASAQLRTVRFGSTVSMADAGVIIARDRGYFREQGIELDFVPFQSGPDTMVPMASGDLEVGSGNFAIV